MEHVVTLENENYDFILNDVECEFSDELQQHKTAKIKIPLMHVGPSLKNVYWKREVLERLAPSFQGTVFKYDVNGSQGSSHVPEHLYSPFYDVGWSYKDYRGGSFDGTVLWTEGEVTKPDVVDKLSRVTSDGQKELEAASMGVLLDYANCTCSICNKRPFGTCGHVRGEVYDGKTCYIVPEVDGVKKVLHIALTNNPADTEAKIAEVVFQENQFNKNMEEGIMAELNEKKVLKEMPSGDNQEPKTMIVKTSEDKKTMGKTIVCPSCGHKFSSEVAEMPVDGDSAPEPVANNNAEPTKNSLPKISNPDDQTTTAGISKMKVQGKVESADANVFELKYKNKLVESINAECARLNREAVEFADLDVSQLELAEKILKTTPSVEYADDSDEESDIDEDAEESGYEGEDINYGSPESDDDLEVADMSADQRDQRFGEFGKWAVIFNKKFVEQL